MPREPWVRDRVFDYLETDGGWLTAEGIGLGVGACEDKISRALRQFREDGLVVSRKVELAYSFVGGGPAMQYRTEWRVV